jgi:3-hydroxybutyryl-CoA dehydrogenase
LPANVIRINAWPGFLERSVVEISAIKINETQVSSIMETLGWKYELVPDIAGMITARTIAMIVNEAYFALADEVSTKVAIDIAMKLGTNYPLGPFEWSEKIGLQNIAQLLSKLSETEARYTPAPLLINEITR